MTLPLAAKSGKRKTKSATSVPVVERVWSFLKVLFKFISSFARLLLDPCFCSNPVKEGIFCQVLLNDGSLCETQICDLDDISCFFDGRCEAKL